MLFLLFVFGNLVFFAWDRGYFGAAGASDLQQRIQPLNADKLHVVGRGAAAAAPTAGASATFGAVAAGATPPAQPAAAASAAAKDTPAPPAAPAVAPAVATAVTPAATDTPKVCRQVSGIGRDIADSLAAAAKAGPNGVAYEEKLVGEASAYWVHYPALPNRQAAERKVAELRALGVDDLFIVPDSQTARNAISLGLFHNEGAARDLMGRLEKKGVKGARIEVREGADSKFQVRLSGPRKRLDAIFESAGLGARAADCT
ncbi:MAG: SPOR domain-containing protein [Rhodocyclaceae bacterium]|nr:SPOR domain-containing protein [Rhodocyclaceae bacterium]